MLNYLWNGNWIEEEVLGKYCFTFERKLNIEKI